MKKRMYILSICTAYEAGYGKGYERGGVPNPYPDDSDTCIAWDIGYSEGARASSGLLHPTTPAQENER